MENGERAAMRRQEEALLVLLDAIEEAYGEVSPVVADRMARLALRLAGHGLVKIVCPWLFPRSLWSVRMDISGAIDIAADADTRGDGSHRRREDARLLREGWILADKPDARTEEDL